MKSALGPRTAATDMDRRAAKSLGLCTFVPGTSVKRFAHQMFEEQRSSDWQLTEKQRMYLYTACHRFRRQIKDQGVLLVAAAFDRLNKEDA